MARPAWFDYDRREEYDAILSPVKVPMRNGWRLDGDLALPAHGTKPAEGQFPTLVIHYTPYGKGRRAENLEWWARHGYAVICCDVRGTQASDGTFPGALSAEENEDNYDLIEWMAAQPFSNGKVGQYGQSYGGMTSFRVASLQPPHLAAIAPQESYSSYYAHTTYPGGIPAGPMRSWANGVPGYTGGRQSAEWLKELWALHPMRDAFWRQVDIDTKYGDIKVPALLFGGWFDVFREGMVTNFLGIEDHAWFVIGPWTHGNPDQMENAPAPRGLLLAWFDRWLAGLDAPLPSAKVTSYEIPRTTSAGWGEFDSYPPSHAQRWQLHLNTDGTLGDKPGEAGVASYVVNATDSTTVVEGMAPGLRDDPAIDHRARDDARLHFETAPLERDLVVIGRTALHLKASLTAFEGYLIANLMDVSPDGRVNQASVGYLLASRREGLDRHVPVEPGETYTFEVPIRAVHWRFGAGHRIRISLTSGDYPALTGGAPDGTVTVSTGDGGSSAELTFIEG